MKLSNKIKIKLAQSITCCMLFMQYVGISVVIIVNVYGITKSYEYTAYVILILFVIGFFVINKIYTIYTSLSKLLDRK